MPSPRLPNHAEPTSQRNGVPMRAGRTVSAIPRTTTDLRRAPACGRQHFRVLLVQAPPNPLFVAGDRTDAPRTAVSSVEEEIHDLVAGVPGRAGPAAGGIPAPAAGIRCRPGGGGAGAARRDRPRTPDAAGGGRTRGRRVHRAFPGRAPTADGRPATHPLVRTGRAGVAHRGAPGLAPAAHGRRRLVAGHPRRLSVPAPPRRRRGRSAGPAVARRGHVGRGIRPRRTR
jgi:hypothetical protein